MKNPLKFNPFKPGTIVTPAMFVGRMAEVKAIDQALFQSKNGSQSHFLIHGERGIGKSSLMMWAAFTARRAPLAFLTVEVELSTQDNYLGIVSKIGRALGRVAKQRAVAKARTLAALEFFSRFEVAGVKYNTPQTVAQEEHEILRDLADAIVATLRDPETHGILILIDEANKPGPTAGLGQICKTLTEMLTKENCERVTIGLAGTSELLDSLRESHESSVRLFHVLLLKPLTPGEQEQAVNIALEEANKKNLHPTTISTEALNHLVASSDGYPHFLQQFGHSAFAADVDNDISLDDTARGLLHAYEQLGRMYFEAMYTDQISSDRYRAVLQVMAPSGIEYVAKAKIRQLSGLQESDVTNAIKALLDRRLILAKPGVRGEYRLQSNAFAIWLAVLGHRKAEHFKPKC